MKIAFLENTMILEQKSKNLRDFFSFKEKSERNGLRPLLGHFKQFFCRIRKVLKKS